MNATSLAGNSATPTPRSAAARTPPRGVITALTVKPQRKAPMLSQAGVVAVAGHGLQGDCHAQPLGPRQALIVRQEDLDRHALSIAQVRANIAVSGFSADDLASGRVLALGSDVRLRVTHECEVCKVLRDYVPANVFPRLPGQRGVLGVFLEGGEIGVGDAAKLAPDRFATVPDGIFDRFAWVLARVPPGRVTTYQTLVTLVGASKPYFRVLPTYLRRAAVRGLPAHRVLNSAARITGHFETQAEDLAQEGVEIGAGGVLASLDTLWDGRDIYSVAGEHSYCSY
jgi:MOSC domain-containing protein YiiM/alkylated DNA nucleotide flippase Atl1